MEAKEAKGAKGAKGAKDAKEDEEDKVEKGAKEAKGEKGEMENEKKLPHTPFYRTSLSKTSLPSTVLKMCTPVLTGTGGLNVFQTMLLMYRLEYGPFPAKRTSGIRRRGGIAIARVSFLN